MKYFLLLLFLCVSYTLTAQNENEEESEKKDYGNLYGGFETNSQLYLEDSGLNFTQPDEPFKIGRAHV